jgi:hypothetical protein
MADAFSRHTFNHCPLHGSCSTLNVALNGTTMDLGTATTEQFEPLKGETFSVDEQDYTLQLVAVTALVTSQTHLERGPFSLTFKGRCPGMPSQALYRLSHPTAGELEIFLVPVGMEEEDYLFEAVFN